MFPEISSPTRRFVCRDQRSDIILLEVELHFSVAFCINPHRVFLASSAISRPVIPGDFHDSRSKKMRNKSKAKTVVALDLGQQSASKAYVS
jgi:hypothetical protein